MDECKFKEFKRKETAVQKVQNFSGTGVEILGLNLTTATVKIPKCSAKIKVSIRILSYSRNADSSFPVL